MTNFKAVVTQDVEPNRLLSLTGGNGVPQISITEPGGNPDFKSTGELEADTEITVTLKNDPIWSVEAGEDLSAGAHVEVGEDGLIIASESTGIGYVAESVETGGIAKLVRQSGGGSGERGPQGPQGPRGQKGDKGDPGDNQFSADEVEALKALIDGESE
ncbi:hypothetical protein ACS127_10365 [Amphibacillus sp. Q70]|uniref:hypothetical protein n=1 Tax=Amphibacillus sp. Q70 TaxID=3453416 RepID=UPI003F8442E6